MKKATYRGDAGIARIRAQDWEAVGVQSKEVVWHGYGDVQEVNEDAAAYLADNDNRFEVEGAGEDSAYAVRLATSPREQINRRRVGTNVVGEIATHETYDEDEGEE